MKLKWYGQEHEVDCSNARRATLGTGEHVAILWPPGAGALRRERWIADMTFKFTYDFIEAQGETAQEALDALAMKLDHRLKTQRRWGPWILDEANLRLHYERGGSIDLRDLGEVQQRTIELVTNPSVPREDIGHLVDALRATVPRLPLPA